MSIKTIVLNFPRSLTQEPVTYHLVKDYDIKFNILRARIKPDEKGTLVLQIKGSEENLEKAFEYLNQIGIQWETLAQGINWDENICTHCTACTSLCPTEALYVDREKMYVNFDKEKCIACEMCLRACAYKAITLDI